MRNFYEFNMKVTVKSDHDDTLDEPVAKIATLLVILFVSFFASSFPSLSNRVSFLKIPHVLFFIGKHFGTGVILSTAFVHLLQDAFETLLVLQTPIKKWIGLIVLSSLLAIFLVEYISMTYVERLEGEGRVDLGHHHHHHHHRGESRRDRPPTYNTTSISIPSAHYSNAGLPQDGEQRSDNSEPSTVTAVSSDTIASEQTPLLSDGDLARTGVPQAPSDSIVTAYYTTPSRRYDRRDGCSKMEHYASIIKIPVNAKVNSLEDGDRNWERRHGQNHTVAAGTDTDIEVSSLRQVVAIMVLQTGIMIHSIVIGLTLSLTSGSKFASLVTAIVFHQLFEGLSLGIRISSLKQSDGVTGLLKYLKPSLIVLFSIAMPISILIGLKLLPRGGHSESRAQMQLTRGLMSAISAGMLIYATCVEMLAGDFTTDVSLMRGSRRRQFLAMMSLFVGAAAMAILAIWQ